MVARNVRNRIEKAAHQMAMDANPPMVYTIGVHEDIEQPPLPEVYRENIDLLVKLRWFGPPDPDDPQFQEHTATPQA